MIRTHPDELPIGVVFSSRSTLGRLDLVIVFSGDRDLNEDFVLVLVLDIEGVRAEEGPAFGGGGGGTGPEVPEATRLLTLPIRILGTRV